MDKLDESEKKRAASSKPIPNSAKKQCPKRNDTSQGSDAHPAVVVLAAAARAPSPRAPSSTPSKDVVTPSIEECIQYLEKNPTMRHVIGLLIDQEEKLHQEEVTLNSNAPDQSLQATDDDDCSVDEDDDDGDNTCDGSFFDEWSTDRFAVELTDGRYAPNVAWHHLLEGGDDDLEITDFVAIELLSSSRLEEIDKDYIDQKTKSSPSATAVTAFPTLQELAFQRLSRTFKKRAWKNEQQSTKLLRILLDKTNDAVVDLFSQHIKELLRSLEAAMVHLLVPLLATARHKLSMLNKEHLDDAKIGRKKILQDANKERAKIKHDWFAKRQSILNDHQEFVDQHANHHDADSQKVLCSAPSCRDVFNLGQVTEKKRCSVPNCMSTHPSCGCNMKTCKRCKSTICKFHVKSHRTTCIETCQRTCGFDARRNIIDFRYCQQQQPTMERIAECEDCSVKCCLYGNCSTQCDNCNTVYCKRCVPFGGFLYAACCSTPFPRTLPM